MSVFKDLTGQKFGRLTVIERVENKGNRACWRCKCDCGNETTVTSTNLTGKRVLSCGCLKKDALFVHGMSNSKIHRIWTNIKTRCLNPNNPKFPSYGGRGIKICESWFVFQTFYDYVSQLPHFGEEGYTLDRINNDGNYEPNNVRWTNAKTQCRNRRSNIIVEYDKTEMTVAEAAEKTGINYFTLRNRLKNASSEKNLYRKVGRGSSKLDEEKVARIREMYKTGQFTQTELGNIFGVSHATISNIVIYKNWVK